MASLTGIRTGIFDTLNLVHNNEVVEIRDLFGQTSQNVSNPTANSVLSIPGLIQELNLKRNVADSYTSSQTDTFSAPVF